MRLSAASGIDSHRYRVYDYPAGQFRIDSCWVDDVLNQVGVGYAAQGKEYVQRVEQRKRVLIIPSVYWIALDLPEEGEMIEKKISIPELFGRREPERVVVR